MEKENKINNLAAGNESMIFLLRGNCNLALLASVPYLALSKCQYMPCHSGALIYEALLQNIVNLSSLFLEMREYLLILAKHLESMCYVGLLGRCVYKGAHLSSLDLESLSRVSP